MTSTMARSILLPTVQKNEYRAGSWASIQNVSRAGFNRQISNALRSSDCDPRSPPPRRHEWVFSTNSIDVETSSSPRTRFVDFSVHPGDARRLQFDQSRRSNAAHGEFSRKAPMTFVFFGCTAGSLGRPSFFSLGRRPCRFSIVCVESLSSNFHTFNVKVSHCKH